MAKPKQEEMFKQGRIPAVETWADKFDDIRAQIGGLADDLKNAEFKLAEVMHQNEAKVDRQAGPQGGVWLVYERNGYSVKIKQGKERVNVKILEKQKGAPPSDAAPEGDA